MSDFLPSLIDVEAFVAQKKEVDGKMKWKRKENAYLTCSSVLIGEDGIGIPQARIILTVNPDEALYKFSFTLWYRGQSVRRLDIDDTHSRSNPPLCQEYGGQRIKGNHLHLWTPENGEGCVIPVDIPARQKTHKDWLNYFFERTNLFYNGTYIRPPWIQAEPRLL